ncbi:NDR1/HIN1-like protein 12, partial [Ananas comosus]|uniref:NDR1/HIN1-like protein 12 n=1 Tax=Ananas comosus TaxID=4615 RepID=A0A6P5EL85_ANACO
MPHDDGGASGKPERRYHGSGAGRAVCSGVLAFVVIAGIVALVLYLVYRPSRPRFSVTGAAIYALTTNSNATAAANPFAYPANPPAVVATMQFTLLVRNPNDRSAVRYDRLSAYVSYRDEPLTLPTPLPPLIQAKSPPFLSNYYYYYYYKQPARWRCRRFWGAGRRCGAARDGDGTDEAYGVVALRLVVLGRAKFKSGPFHSRWYGLYVRCDVLVGVRKGVAGQVPLLGNPDCHVDM